MGAPFVFVLGIMALIAPIAYFFSDPIGTVASAIRIFESVISTIFTM